MNLRASKLLERLEEHRLSHAALEMNMSLKQRTDEELEEIAAVNVERVAAVRVITEAVRHEMMMRGLTPSEVFEEAYMKTVFDPVN